MSDAASTGKKLRGRPFQPGQSGNPKGRPPGSRNELCEAFVADLRADWDKHGPAAIRQVREEKPDAYLKVVASLVPKEMHVRVDPLEELTDEQLYERIRQLDAAIRPFLNGEGVSGADGRGEETTRH